MPAASVPSSTAPPFSLDDEVLRAGPLNADEPHGDEHHAVEPPGHADAVPIDLTEDEPAFTESQIRAQAVLNDHVDEYSTFWNAAVSLEKVFRRLDPLFTEGFALPTGSGLEYVTALLGVLVRQLHGSQPDDDASTAAVAQQATYLLRLICSLLYDDVDPATLVEVHAAVEAKGEEMGAELKTRDAEIARLRSEVNTERERFRVAAMEHKHARDAAQVELENAHAAKRCAQASQRDVAQREQKFLREIAEAVTTTMSTVLWGRRVHASAGKRGGGARGSPTSA
jgi:hypothetical protein